MQLALGLLCSLGACPAAKVGIFESSTGAVVSTVVRSARPVWAVSSRTNKPSMALEDWTRVHSMYYKLHCVPCEMEICPRVGVLDSCRHFACYPDARVLRIQLAILLSSVDFDCVLLSAVIVFHSDWVQSASTHALNTLEPAWVISKWAGTNVEVGSCRCLSIMLLGVLDYVCSEVVSACLVAWVCNCKTHSIEGWSARSIRPTGGLLPTT